MANSAVMGTPTVHCWWGDETAMEGTGYTPFHMLRAKKMKLLTLQRAKAASALAYGTDRKSVV